MALRAAPLRAELAPPPLSTTEGGFKTILADPPWRFTNRTGKAAPEHRRLDRYSTMDFGAICALPVVDIAADNAHLHLWVRNALLPEGLRVREAWGFRYVSNSVWAKRRRDGGPDGRGVGFYFRNVTELLLFGVRGSLRTLQPVRSQVNMIETRKREHSWKPDEQYPLIEECSPEPYLELFARHPAPGWTVWGDEADAEIEPSDKTHKGYEGGPIRTPQLPLYARVEDVTADILGEELRRRYESGRSIRDLSVETNYSIGRVRSLLQRVDAPIRSRGAQPSLSHDSSNTPEYAVTPCLADAMDE